MTAQQAMAVSHEFLQRHGVQINEALPLIEEVEDLVPQDAAAIARRCIVLIHMIGIGYGADVARLRRALQEFGLLDRASEGERRLLDRSEHSDQEKNAAMWCTESVQSLAWCLDLVDLDPFRPCDDNLAFRFPAPFEDPNPFIQRASLRPFAEIYQQCDLHYRLHWAARNASLTGEPSRVDETLIRERRRGIDWAVGVEADWDDVPMDT